jgi:hypothetical protein
MRKIESERIERAARIYASNQEASQALDIAPGSFSRLCRAYGIETPYVRRRRRREECRYRRLARKTVEQQLGIGELDALDLDVDEVLATATELQDVP